MIDKIDELIHDLDCNHKAIGRKESIYSRAIATIKELQKKSPLTSLNMLKVSQLTYPILMAQMEGEISEAKAAELIGVDIVSLRQIKGQTIKSIMDMLEFITIAVDLASGRYEGKATVFPLGNEPRHPCLISKSEVVP